MTRVRGIRGATTADDNSKEAILEATGELLESLVRANDLEVDDIAAAMFSTTEDLDAEFPTVAARQMGWEYVPLINFHEMKVPDAATRCVRVLVLVNTAKAPRDIAHVYLRGAVDLRERGMENSL